MCHRHYTVATGCVRLETLEMKRKQQYARRTEKNQKEQADMTDSHVEPKRKATKEFDVTLSRNKSVWRTRNNYDDDCFLCNLNTI